MSIQAWPWNSRYSDSGSDPCRQREEGRVTFVVVTEMNMHESYFHEILNNCINDAVIITSNPYPGATEPQIVFVNTAFCLLTGYSQEEVTGKPPALLFGPDTDLQTRREFSLALQQNRPIHKEILNYTKSGNPYWVDFKLLPLTEGLDVTHFVIIARDLTESRRMQQELYRLTDSDVQTGIANGEHFMVLAESEFYRARRYGRPLAVVRFDLDNYIGMNLSHGREAAKDALKTVADNCRTLLRQSDLFGRIGGEKFALLLPETGIEPAEELADRLCMLLSVIQVCTESGEFAITASFGVTVTTISDENLFEVLGRADAALADARQAGKNTVRTRSAGYIRQLKIS